MVCVRNSLAHVLAVTVGAAASGGDLTPPPGPVSPTMKSLASVEPRIEVNAENTPGCAGVTYTISHPGSYYLGGDVFGAEGQIGILIESDFVTLDLNGFTVQGGELAISGIVILEAAGVTVRNGFITGWPGAGLDAQFVDGGRFEGLSVRECQLGILVGDNALVSDCISEFNQSAGIVGGRSVVVDRSIARNNGDHGVQISELAVVRGCAATDNTGSGIVVPDGGVVIESVASGNLRNGFVAGGGVQIRSSFASHNVQSGVVAGEGSVISGTRACDNGIDGIDAGSAATIENCTSTGNGDDGIAFRSGSSLQDNVATLNETGFHQNAAAQCRLDGNFAYSNSEYGFRLSGPLNVVTRNVARQSGIQDFLNSPNSQTGPIHTAQIASTTGAWANFAESVGAASASEKNDDREAEPTTYLVGPFLFGGSRCP